MERRTYILAAHLWLAWLFAAALIVAASDRPTPKAPQIPAVAGKCHWGTVTQVNARIAIAGGGSWEASGEWKSEQFILDWTCLSGGRTAHAEYEWKDGALVGWWGWHDELEFGEDGSIQGPTESFHDETIQVTRP